MYGPVEELLNDRDRSLNYQNLIGDVISKLHGRGVYLGLMSPNSIVQGAALRQAGLIFKESAQIEEYLYGLLEEFLHNSSRETSLRIHAAEIINTATDLNRRLKTLSKLLLEETELRNIAVRCLNPYKPELARVELDAYTVLEALNFEYRLDQPDLKDLAIPEIERIITSSSQAIDVISARFATALGAAESLGRKYGKSAWVVRQFFQNKQDEYQADIESLIQKLNVQKSQTLEEQSKIESNLLLLKECFLSIHNFGFKLSSKFAYLEQYEALKNTDYKNFTYSQCQKWLSELVILKKNIIAHLNQEKIKSEVGKLDRVLLLVVCIIFLGIPGFLASVVILQNLFPSDSLGWLRAAIFFVTFIIAPLLFLLKFDFDSNRKKKKINLMIEKLNEQWI